MINTVYKDFIEVNKLQTDIMLFVDYWVKTEKKPVPQKEIYKKMAESNKKHCTVENALYSLIRKGYIRKAYTISNRTFYVQLRRV